MSIRKAAGKTMRNIQRGMIPDDRARGIYGENVRLGIVRSRLLTESYKMTEGEPMVIRRAKALEHILLKMPVYIEDRQLIVGNYAESPDHLVHFIEQNWRSVKRVIQPGAPGETLTDDVGREEFDKLCEYWDGRSLREILSRSMNEEMSRYFKYEGTILWSLLSEGHVPNYEKVFKVGLNGIIRQAEDRLAEIEDLVPIDYFEQKDFLNAAIITLKATIEFARRFAAKAWDLAGSENDQKRKKQLLEIAKVCDWVPANPPRTLQEAIQSFWLIHVIIHQIEFITIGIGARLDVLFNPYYIKDKEEEKTTMKELLDAIDNNWEGREDLRQMIKTRAPKYGNDDDYVDAIAKEVHQRTEEAVEESLNPFGISYKGDGSGVSATYGLAGDCEATPDGRKNGEPFADGTISPMPGADVKGPTAILASAAKVGTPYNQLLNQKFMPRFLEGENKEMFYSYLKTWGDMGISHIQFNVVDKETLLNAQEYPEEHTDLIVRVAGYSAYFVDLSKGLQDNIIERTEQNFT